MKAVASAARAARWAAPACALVVALVAALITFSLSWDPLKGDQAAYARVALDFARLGYVSDGEYVRGEGRGMFFAPALPMMLGALARLDADLIATLECVAAGSRTCDGAPLLSFFVLQAAFVGLAAAAAFFIARPFVGNGPALAIGVLFVSLGDSAELGRQIMTDPPALAFLLLAQACAVAGALTGRWIWWLAAGAALGLAALTRPTYLYLAPLALVLICIWLCAIERRRWRAVLAPIIVFTLGLAGTVTPWMARNQHHFGTFALSSGYGGFILVQRLAYNDMRPDEYAASFVHWFPDFGDTMARAVFPPETLGRLDYASERYETFYEAGNGRLSEETLAAAGGRENHLAYLVEHHLLPNLGKHMLVTVPIAVRGMWAGEHAGWLALALCPFAWTGLRRARRAGAFLVLLAPHLLLLGFHAAVSVNVTRYNEPLLIFYLITVFLAVIELARLAVRRRKAETPGRSTSA